MTVLGILFLVVASGLTFGLPRPYAIVPLLLAAGYMSAGEMLELGGATFTIPRLLVAAGFMRALMRREALEGGLRSVDRLVFLWGVVLIGTSVFHTADAWVYRAGMAWSELGGYFLMRIYLRDLDDLRRIFGILALALVPLAVLMVVEKATNVNLFGVLSGVSDVATVRQGHVRASGPFAHSILAGTVGAACLGLGLGLFGGARARALTGMLAGAAIVICSASSGPLLMAALIAAGMCTWIVRERMQPIRWLVLAFILLLDAVMIDPVYFLMARIDFVGGSQGWFRAQLIRSSIEHLSEWWLGGTDHTRHWMSTGITASTRHTDITNHFLSMGVLGGLPLMAVFIAIVIVSFRNVGRTVRCLATAPAADRRLVWALGALLFGFVMDFLSITLFDASVLFFWMTIAAITCAAPSRASQMRVLAPTRAIEPLVYATRHGGFAGVDVAALGRR